jgi:hypothetical protein
MSQSALPYPWSWWTLNLPDNVQSIAPMTNWGQITQVTYQGNPAIEKRVTEQVASFGKQLGIISEAVLTIARRLDGIEHEPEIQRLIELARQVDKVKAESRQEVEARMLEEMSFVAELDEGEAEMLVSRLAKVINEVRRKKKRVAVKP